MGKALVNPNNLNFGPRVGINYTLGTKWSIRSGFGIFYATDIGNAVFDMSRNLGGKDGAVVASNARTVNLSAPWAGEQGSASCPGYSGPCIAGPQINPISKTIARRTLNNGSPTCSGRSRRTLWWRWVIWVIRGHHLDRDFIVNQAVPKTGPTDNSSTTSRRPFPKFGPIQQAASFDNANYNAGTIKLSQRLSHGLLYVVAYTWSKSLDGGSALRNNTGDTLWPTNSYNLRAERGLSQFDLPRRFVASYLYDLPFGPGRRFVTGGFLSQIIGGWQFGGILTLADGTPFNVAQLGDTAGLGNFGQSAGLRRRESGSFQSHGQPLLEPSGLQLHQSGLELAGRATRVEILWLLPGARILTRPFRKTSTSGSPTLSNFRFETFNTLNISTGMCRQTIPAISLPLG